MYLGHFIFMLGLALTFQSILALALLLATVVILQAHAVRDEKRLRELFGAAYDDYAKRVKRWIPFLL